MQYGQRKLQRSMTEMRRSRSGRPSVSRGAAAPSGRELNGTMTSDRAMISKVYHRAAAKPIGRGYGRYGAECAGAITSGAGG